MKLGSVKLHLFSDVVKQNYFDYEGHKKTHHRIEIHIVLKIKNICQL